MGLVGIELILKQQKHKTKCQILELESININKRTMHEGRKTEP